MIIKKCSIEKSSFRVCLKFLSIMILKLPLTCQMAQEELLVWLFNTNNLGKLMRLMHLMKTLSIH